MIVSSGRILLVDDEPRNLALLDATLRRAGHAELRQARGGGEALEQCAAWAPDLVLLDLHMPGTDGFAVLRALDGAVPVLVLTADATPEAKRAALQAGARDFLTKPFDLVEVGLRVKLQLETRALQRALERQNRDLEDRVRRRTEDLERARLELLHRLALAAEFRDDDTQEHAERVGRTSAAVGRGLGLEDADVEVLRRAAPLHDIGKIGVPDAVLLKPGRLTARELTVVRAHATIGARMLAGSQSPVLQLAERIALTHHERWDGAGYPEGTTGPQIDLTGRIVAVADVFDALAHARPYKPAWPLEEALDEVAEQRGRQFDPAVADAFLALDHAALLAPVQTEPLAGRTRG
jgi:putative two-component system response regulator